MKTTRSKLSIFALSIASLALFSTAHAQITIDKEFAGEQITGSNQTITFASGAVSSENTAVTIGGTDNTVTVEGTANLSSGTFTMNGSYGNGNTLSITGGSLQDLQVNAKTTTNISGGSILGNAAALNGAALNMSGGEILGTFTAAASDVLIDAGSFGGDFNVSNSSTVYINGGLFDSSDTLSVVGSAMVYIAGSSFFLDGIAVTSSTIPSVSSGLLTGTLANNDAFAMNIDVANQGVIHLAAVPEPSTIAATFAGLGLLFFISRKKRQHSNAC